MTFAASSMAYCISVRSSPRSMNLEATSRNSFASLLSGGESSISSWSLPSVPVEPKYQTWPKEQVAA